MKKKLLFLFGLMLTGTLCYASFSIDWIRKPDLLANIGAAITRDAADNVYTLTNNEGSIYLEKRNRFGVFQWQQISSTTVALNYERPVQVHVDPQGNPVVIGYRHTMSSDGDNANALIVLKYDPAGSLIYKRIFPGSYSYFNNSQYWTHVSSQMDNNGNVYIGTAGLVGSSANSGYNVVKVSPAGNIVRVSTKNFPSVTNFHFVRQIRLYGDKLGLAGVTDYSTANASTWVVDTAGNDIWSDVSTGVQGDDIAFDANGNAYMVTWISTAQMGDIAVYKYDPLGNSLWVRTFDFGGSEVGGKILATPDGNFAIMASGNQAPSTSYYLDWITFKIDTSGTQLWSDRYDETTHNDEYPGAFAVDDGGNIYVTGTGGPFPGGTSIISTIQMVTVKYTPSGTREWTAPTDTFATDNRGNGIAIASDSSVFIISYSNSVIIHYLDHSGTAPCTVPTNISSTVLANDSVQINWSPVSNAYLYHVRFKTSTALVWDVVSTNNTSCILSPLYAGTDYDYAVEAICSSGPTGYSAVQQFTTSGTGYCTSMGLDATHEWIDLVFLGSLLNSTPLSDGGYGDYTFLSADLLPGSTYNITLSAEMDVPMYTENWKVWIDFNRNGLFSDPGEEVVSYSSNQIGWETSTFQVPANAVPGVTRMRVSMKDGSPVQTPCEIFSLGEVEDYSININSITGISPEANKQQNSLSVYPNPATNLLIVNSGTSTGTVSYEIMDLTGRTVFADPFAPAGKISIDIQNLNSGIYFVKMKNESGTSSVVKWMKQ